MEEDGVIIYGEDGFIFDEYPEEDGWVEFASIDVWHVWIEESPEAGHYETVSENAETGGRLVEWVVDQPAVGRWVVVDSDGEEVADFDMAADGDWPKGDRIPDVFTYGVFHPAPIEEEEPDGI